MLDRGARRHVDGKLSAADLEVKIPIDGEYTASPSLDMSRRDRLYGYADRVAESARKKGVRRGVWEAWRVRTIRQKKLVKRCEMLTQVCMHVCMYACMHVLMCVANDLLCLLVHTILDKRNWSKDLCAWDEAHTSIHRYVFIYMITQHRNARTSRMALDL